MARKWLILCSTLLLMLLVLPAAAFAAESPVTSIVVSDNQPSLGQSVQVTVKADHISDLYALELAVYYDPALLEFQAGSEKTELKGFAVPVKQSEAGGHHLLFAHTKTGSTASVSGSADLVTFTFVAKQQSNAAITIKDVKLIDSKLNQTSVTTPSIATITIAGGVGGPPSTPTPTPGAGAETDVVDVLAQQLTSAEGNKVKVTLPANIAKVRLPYNAAELLGSSSLEVQAGGMKLLVPQDVLKQLEGKVSAERLKDSSIILLAEPLKESLSNELMGLVQTKTNGEIKAGGSIFDFALYLQFKDGSTEALTAFIKPLTIKMPLASSINAKLAGIFYVANDGSLQYVGGEVVGGEMVAEISHFSKYALLEVNKSFTDVPSSHWASAVIKELAAKQIVTGTSAAAFEPARSVTRAEFTSLLVRALKLTDEGASTFTDVNATAWYANDINKAVKAGLIQGRSALTFAPAEQITREELAVLVLRAYELKSGTAQETSHPAFKDASQISAWAVKDVNKAAALGLLQGRTTGLFVPKGISNRAEAAQVIYHLLFK
ncbi:S-layer homology domain-containing protein [Paenibacillus sp. FJAT-27812]|uniref:S-layer homology domain-containing protein n=1 Tax=Paenibacillus sp. FJAT-27812 TaxID=1684143 RepID=UPI0006A7A2AB|nr:S-layer homology domain-containing protein [Paenibacillus sp. FJAT-27812]